MQTIAAKAATMISKSLMAFSQWPYAENASAMLLFHSPRATRRGRYAANIAKLPELVRKA